MAQALEGIKVVDVSQVAAVPMCARHLADFGADVIHIENPVTGDSWRGFQSGVYGAASVPSDINYNWEVFNRNKRAITLNLTQMAGQQVLHKLVEGADVFVTNLRLWEREKFDVKYETLHKLNPRLIYGSLTGQGKKGPDRNAPAYDFSAAWLRAGMSHMFSYTGMPNVSYRTAFVDTVAALALFAGIMTALYARERTGVGQEVEMSLFNIGMYQLSYDIAGALVTGQDIKEWIAENTDPEDPEVKRRAELTAEAQAVVNSLSEVARRIDYPNPLASYYITKDERLLGVVALQSDRYWSKMCQVIGREDIEHNPRFENHQARIDNRTALYEIMGEAFRSRNLEEWKQCLSEAGIPFGVQQKLSEVIKDPQARANDYFASFEHPTYGRIEVMANPIQLSETPATVRMPAPEFNQHTEEVLLALGYTWEDIAQFKEHGTIA